MMPATLSDGAIEFKYEDGPFIYRDRYFGANPFIGQETVWQDGKIIWAMNYYGGLIDVKFQPASVYAFLKKALRELKPERPYRGPEKFIDGEMEYRDQSTGSLDNFQGIELIICQQQEIYRLWYHGGLVR